MKLLWVSFLIISIFLVGCKGETTGHTTLENPTATKELVKEEDLIKADPEEKLSAKTQSTCDTIEKIKDDIYTDNFNIGQIEGDITKKYREVQYYKEKENQQEKYQQILDEIDQMKEEVKKKKEKLTAKIEGFKILAETCGVDVKLKKF